MAQAIRILWVTDESPDRDRGGGSIRQAHLFEALAQAYPVELVVVGGTRDQGVRAAAGELRELPKRSGLWTEQPLGRRLLELGIMIGSPYPSYAYPARPARKTLSRTLRHPGTTYDLACIEHAALAPLRLRGIARTRVITFHHLFSGMARQELAIAPGPRQRAYREIDLRKAERLERRALREYDHLIVCSREDAQGLGGSGAPLDRSRISIVPNGVDLTAFTPDPVPGEPRILFPATLGYAPNVDGALWFCSEIWPRLRAAIPAATLQLVGRAPVPEVRALGGIDGVSVHADVPSMSPYYESARAVVVPLRSGTGTRLKALEAMSSGRPLVGTTIGLEGIDVRDGEQVLIADEPESFAGALQRVLSDDALAASLAVSAREHVERHFGWEKIGRDYVALIGDLIERQTLK